MTVFDILLIPYKIDIFVFILIKIVISLFFFRRTILMVIFCCPFISTTLLDQLASLAVSVFDQNHDYLHCFCFVHWHQKQAYDTVATMQQKRNGDVTIDVLHNVVCVTFALLKNNIIELATQTVVFKNHRVNNEFTHAE